MMSTADDFPRRIMTAARDLADRFHQRWLTENPFSASMYGIPGYDDLMPDESEEGAQAWRAEAERFLGEADAIDPGPLTPADVVTLDCTREMATQELTMIDMGRTEHTVTAMQYAGPAVLMAVAARTVLLDAAAFVPTNRLDLAVVKPEFVTVSWYKMFGYPTGIGCLLARRDALARLRRPWFSGGTVWGASVLGGWHRLAADETAFEDGTVNFLGIPDVAAGLAWIGDIGIDLIHRRVGCLTSWLLGCLAGLKHGNGAPMVRLYGPPDGEARGGTVAFNFLDARGAVVDERAVVRDASAAGISLRAGCFCNPGAWEQAFGLTRRVVREGWREFGRRDLRTVDDYLELTGLPSGGAVRVSLGLVSSVGDVERFLDFAERTYRDREPGRDGLAPRLRC